MAGDSNHRSKYDKMNSVMQLVARNQLSIDMKEALRILNGELYYGQSSLPELQMRA